MHTVSMWGETDSVYQR